MIAFALHPANLPFAVALGVMLVIAAIEIVGMMVGASVSEAIDTLLPEADLDIDVEAPDVDGIGGAAGVLDWLCVGRVPALIVLVFFLFFFGVTGLILQGLAQATFGNPLPPLLAAPPALVAALPVVHLAGRGFEKLFPRAETYVVSEASFIGQVATITLGIATRGNAAQAKLKDRHGRAHYVQVEPDDEGGRFETGDPVLLVRKEGAVFRAIPATAALLRDA